MLADFVHSVHDSIPSSLPTGCNETDLNSVAFGGYTQRLWILWHLSEDGSSVGVRLPSFARIVLFFAISTPLFEREVTHCQDVSLLGTE